jgi:hypothetical protein
MAPIITATVSSLVSDEGGHALLAGALILAVRYVRSILNGMLALDDRMTSLVRRVNDIDSTIVDVKDQLAAIRHPAEPDDGIH